jgi:serine/threonine protein phosphatase PrpC
VKNIDGVGPDVDNADGEDGWGTKDGVGSAPITAMRSTLSMEIGRTITSGDNESLIVKAGLSEVFSNLGKRRACMCASVTDTDGARKSSFKEKSEEIMYPPAQQDAADDALVAWMQDLGLGWTCKKGMKVNSPNQDSFSILAVEGEFILIGVYDGHGPDGHHVSQFARTEMVRHFIAHPDRGSDTEKAFREVFVQVQQLIMKASGTEEKTSNKQRNAPGSKFDAWESGSTCTMIYLDIPKQSATFAHVADARSCLGKKKKGQKDFISEDMTKDHKPNEPEEKKRITNSTPPGRVIFDGYVNYRVFVKDGMYPGLNMSRALGDVCGHKLAGLTAVPDTRTVDLKPLLKDFEEVAVLVCTDGVWEFIEGDEAFKSVAEEQSRDADSIVNRLALKSWDRWMADSANEISDDITAVCCHLHMALATKP